MLKRSEYFITVNRPYPPLLAALIFKGTSDEEYFRPFFRKPAPVKNIAIVEGNWFYATKEMEKARKTVMREWGSEEKIKKARALYDKLAKDFFDSTKKSFKEFVQAFEAYMPSMHPVYVAEEPIINRLKPFLSANTLDILNIPLENNFFKQEEYDLLHARDLGKHAKKYEWLVSRYGQNKPYTSLEAKRKLKSIKRAQYLRKWKSEKAEIIKTILEAKKMVGSKNSYLIDFMQFIVFYRTYRTDVINRCAYLAIPMLTKFAKSLELTYQELLQLSQIEILNNQIPPKEIIRQRMKENAIISENGKISVVSGPQLSKLKKFFKEKVATATELKGEIACKGLVKGRCVLLVSGQNLSKVKNGDIIVTSMTTPDMVPAMKKAAAFVTNEGGITCHAAIVSREMKKPCIIGTKFATKVFKDGDMVEVDANKGIVRKI